MSEHRHSEPVPPAAPAPTPAGSAVRPRRRSPDGAARPSAGQAAGRSAAQARSGPIPPAEPVDDRRRQLLDVAARLFAERGYQATTLRDIAAAAGILAGSVYHHFPSKADLFAEVHREGFGALIEAVSQAVAREHEPWARLEAAFAAHLEQLLSGQAIASLTNVAILTSDHGDLLRQIQQTRDRYEDLIRQLVADVPLPPHIDRSLLRLALLGALNWTSVWYRPGKKTPAQIARNLVDSIRR